MSSGVCASKPSSVAVSSGAVPLAANSPRGWSGPTLVRAGRWDNALVMPSPSAAIGDQLQGELTGQALPVAAQHSAKATRETENRLCLGGMRNPHTAVVSNPSLSRSGERARAVFCEVAARHKSLLEIADGLGNPDYEGPLPADVAALREALRKAFGAALQSHVNQRYGMASPLKGNIFQAWSDYAGDS